MLVLAVFLLVAALAAGIWAVASTVEEKSVVRASLRQLDGYEVNNVRDSELLKPVSERTVQPLQERLVELGKRFTPDGYAEKVQRKLISAGIQGADAADRFMAVRVICVAMIPLVLILVFGVLAMTGMMALGLAGFLVFACVMGPEAVIDRKIADRQHQIQVKLPDVLDLLVISVEAGLGFEQALDRTVAAVPGPLTDEFSRMLGEVRAGASRADAMRNMEARCDVPELRSFVLAILQADTFGVSIGRVLRAQADEMRIKRRQLAQEQAQKAPVKMLIPMVFCVFPALFVVVIGPAIINIREAF